MLNFTNDCSYCSIPENEIWLPVKNFESSHQISSFGKVKSLKRIIHFQGFNETTDRVIKETILKGGITHSGYREYHLKNLYYLRIRANILIWDHFWHIYSELKENRRLIDNLEVDHKDDIKLHNCIWNLQLLTHKQNGQKRFLITQ